MRNPLRRAKPLPATKRTLSGKRIPRGFAVHREWITLVRPPAGASAVNGVRNAHRVPKRIASCPSPADLAVLTPSQGHGRPVGVRRGTFAERARLREWTPADERAAHERRLAKQRKRARRTGAA